MEEIFTFINNTDNKYSISNFGNVISNKTRNTKNIKKAITKKGYEIISIYTNGVQKTMSVHTLVATHFIDNPLSLLTVNHINGIKHDNHVNNLEWCTLSHNIKHAYINNLMNAKGEKNNRSKLTIEQVIEMRRLHETGIKYSTIMRMFNIAHSTVNSIVNNKSWKHV